MLFSQKKRNSLAVTAIVSIVALFGGWASQARAAGESAETVRADHPLGAYATLRGDPFPALLGINAAYNVNDFLRMFVGVGTDKSDNYQATTFGVGAKLMVPKWALTPVVGLGWSADSSNGPYTRHNVNYGTNRLYGSIGLDWTTALGLNLGGGYNMGLTAGGGGTGYISAGFFL
jgi:hypothetical protein